jgi:uncharacterized metal-binding protein
MSEQKNNKCCTGDLNLVFSCSGAADVGAVSDQAARKLTKEGVGKMYCLAGIGGNVSGIIETTKLAEKILAIDGCPVSCTKKLLEKNGFNDFNYLLLSELNLEKGKSPATDENINKVFNKGKDILS